MSFPRSILTTVMMIFMVLTLAACSVILETEPTPTNTPPPPSPLPPTATPEPSPSPTPSLEVTNLQDVKNAVIQIEAQGTFMDPEFGEVVEVGLGSGFIIDPSGLAVTNNHVVTGAALLKVWVGGDTSQTYNAKIIGVSECSDLALIDIEGDDFPYLSWYQDSVEVGLEVYAAGFPLGDPEYTLTKGIVSKENAGGESSWASVDEVIEHDATINPGSSGGPLITSDGQVVGINYATYSDANQYFAIGRETALSIIDQIREGQDVNSLGINGMAVISEDGALYGIWVFSVASGSPADEAGLKAGDLITSLENLPMAEKGTMENYCDILRTHGPESTLNVEVLRYPTFEIFEGQINGRELTVVTAPMDEMIKQHAVVGVPFIVIQDNTEALYVEVPDTWLEINGTPWEGELGGVNFEAASILISPDLEGFQSYYDVRGVDFSASRDWVQLGGYEALLDITTSWQSGTCEKEGRYEYIDELYEGSYDLWECGTDAALFILAAHPVQNPNEYLLLLIVQLTSEEDADALEMILGSFQVVGPLP